MCGLVRRALAIRRPSAALVGKHIFAGCPANSWRALHARHTGWHSGRVRHGSRPVLGRIGTAALSSEGPAVPASLRMRPRRSQSRRSRAHVGSAAHRQAHRPQLASAICRLSVRASVGSPRRGLRACARARGQPSDAVASRQSDGRATSRKSGPSSVHAIRLSLAGRWWSSAVRGLSPSLSVLRFFHFPTRATITTSNRTTQTCMFSWHSSHNDMHSSAPPPCSPRI